MMMKLKMMMMMMMKMMKKMMVHCLHLSLMKMVFILILRVELIAFTFAYLSSNSFMINNQQPQTKLNMVNVVNVTFCQK